MASEVKLPVLGENVAEGDVVEVHVKAGDEVKAGQALIEVEAEKSTVEVPSPSAGKVSDVRVKKGDKVSTGQIVVVLDGEATEKPADKSEEPRKKESKKEEMKKERKAAEEKAEEAEPEEKKQDERRKERDGKPEKIEAPSRASAAPKKQADEEIAVHAGPATRRIAQDLGVDLTQVSGSGVKGRVTPDDVKEHVRRLSSGRVAQVSAPALPDFEQWGSVEFQPLDGIRRTTARQMSLAWTTIPHVTQHDQADITDLEAFRKQQQESKGPKITVTAFALKAAAIALKEFPQFNASLDLARDRLILKTYYHLGIAVDTERGLLVPVLRDADKKSVHDLAAEMAELADKARNKKLAADDMKGGTFTISNLGGIGGTAFTPIVNYPEVAILGMSRSRWQPVFKEGAFVPRFLLPLSLSYDHRVIDGAAAARFTRRLAELLENPLQMLLHA